MNKDELMDLHEKMAKIKEEVEKKYDVADDAFAAYETEASPSDLGRSKAEHKHAIFVLGREIASVMSDDEFSDAGRLKNRMEEIRSEIDL